MSTSHERLVFEGTIAGLLAYGVVAGIFAVADLLLGRPLFATPAAIGNALFFGAAEPAAVSAGPVAAANGVHILLGLAVGFGAAFLASETERHPQFFYLTFLVVVLLLLVSSALLLGIPSALARATPWGVMLLANVAGGLTAAFYLWRAHPGLRARVDQIAGGEESAA